MLSCEKKLLICCVSLLSALYLLILFCFIIIQSSLLFLLYPGLFWTAPETLREYGQNVDALPATCRCHHQAGDVYAVGVILKEVFCRNEPYSEVAEQYGPKGITFL